MSKIDLEELFKTSLLAFLVGILPSLLLGMIASFLSAWSWLMYIVYALALVWAVPKLPKEADTFFDVLMVTFLLMAFSGLVASFVPGLSLLQWVNIATVTSLLTTMVTAIVALAIVEEYVPI